MGKGVWEGFRVECRTLEFQTGFEGLGVWLFATSVHGFRI